MRTLYTIPAEDIPAAVKAANALTRATNEIVPQLFELLDGQKIGTSTGRPPKAAHDKIEELLKPWKEAGLHNTAYLKYGKYSVTVTIRTAYMTKGHMCEHARYIEKHIYIADVKNGAADCSTLKEDWKPLPTTKTAKVKAAIVKHDKARKAYEKAESDYRAAQYALAYFTLN